MPGTIAAFTTATRSGNIRYGRQSKFQTANYWIPDWTVPQPMPVCWINRGGTLYNPGDDAMQLSSGSFLEELALMMSNDLGAVVIISDYRPGGYGRHQTAVGRIHTAADVERLFFPEVLYDFALPGQFFKGIAGDQSVWGSGNSISTDPDNWLRAGSSSGGWGAGLTQLMPDGTFPYSPGATGSSDEYTPRFSHTCNAVVCSIPQTVFSAFDKGAAADGWNYDTYGEWSHAGAYFQDSRVADETAPFGWDDIPMSVKRQADFGEWITADNHRALEVGFFLTGSNVAGVSMVNDPTGVDADSFPNYYWRYTGTDPATMRTAGTVDNVQAIDGGGITSTFRRSSGDWATEGFAVGERVRSFGFSTGANNDRWTVDSIINSGLDLVVTDTLSTMVDEAAATGRAVQGVGYLDLHDPWNCYVAKDELDLIGNTRSILRAGGANTNPSTAERIPATNALTAADVKTWLVSGEIGTWADPV